MSSEPPSPLDLDDAPTIWDRLCRHVEAFAAAWDASHQPPPIASFLPAEPAVLRKLVLVELIKIDLEYRGQHQCPLRLEDYAARFPELGGRDGLPCDLIYEEYHVRKGTSPDLSPGEYLERFPQQAESLRRLLDLPSAHTLSTLMRPSAADRLAAAPIADFEVLGTLGAGAFATVYLARQLSMQRMVALKVTSPRGDEPQTLAQLDHPHIVRVLDQRSDAEGARRLLYMEWVPGGTLQAVVGAAREKSPEDRTGKLLLEVIDRHLAAHGVLPPDDVERERLAAMPWFEVTAYLGAQLAAALDCAHRRGILHRDVKPANVLLTASGRAKLADFNVSYSSKLDGAAPAAYFGGSLAYMSPEQLEAFNPRHPRQPAELDGRSDLYALAVVLWELLCGRRPFADEGLGGDWAATLERLCERRRRGPPPEALSRLPPQTPPLFVETLLRCLEPDAAARPQTARDLYAQLRSVLQPGLRDLLTPPRGRWSETIRRHLAAAIILAGLLPNAFLSALNISYNWMVTVAALDEAAQRLFLEILLILLNGIFYSLATVVALRAAWPVIRSVRGPPRADLDVARRRCLTLGDWLFWISLASWSVAGAVFPLSLHLSGGTVGPREYLHFLASHVLCGLIAGTLCFFFEAFVSVRFVYPHLLPRQSAGLMDDRPLRALQQRVGLYGHVAVAVPFVSALLLGSTDSGFRGAFAGLAGVGTASLAASFWLTRHIQSDLEALRGAAVPPGEILGHPGEA